MITTLHHSFTPSLTHSPVLFLKPSSRSSAVRSFLLFFSFASFIAGTAPSLLLLLLMVNDTAGAAWYCLVLSWAGAGAGAGADNPAAAEAMATNMSFAKATFAAEGSDEALDLKDPSFWEKVRSPPPVFRHACLLAFACC